MPPRRSGGGPHSGNELFDPNNRGGEFVPFTGRGFKLMDDDSDPVPSVRISGGGGSSGGSAATVVPEQVAAEVEEILEIDDHSGQEEGEEEEEGGGEEEEAGGDAPDQGGVRFEGLRLTSSCSREWYEKHFDECRTLVASWFFSCSARLQSNHVLLGDLESATIKITEGLS